MALFRKSEKPQAEAPKHAAGGPNTYDVVFMGAGHNGLVTAAYLAKAGKKVLLLESRPYFGGGVITRDLTLPGFHHDQHSTAHNLLLANPMFAQDELELKSRFGLEYFYPDVPHVTVFPDDSTLFTYRDLDKTCASFATVSQHDADAYRKFAEKSLKVLPMAIAGAFVPPAPMGQMIAMLDQSEEGREFFHTMQSSPLDIANRLFESDKVKIHLLRLISENLQIPDELGTGVGLLLWPALIHTYGIGQPVGGSGKLAEALVKCVEHHGGTVLVDRKVARVVTSGGRATGLVTEDGEEFVGRDAVVASIHPTKLDQFVEGVPAPVIARGKAVTMAAFSPLAVHIALPELPQLRAGPEASGAVMIIFAQSDRLSDIMDDFSEIRRGRIPQRLLLLGGCSNYTDKTRAPEGKGIMWCGTHGPYELPDGRSWDDFKDELADRVFDAVSKHYVNVSRDSVLARHIDSPLDHERHSPNSFVRGDIHGAAPYFYQSQAHRPTPDLGDYTVPGVERLYLVGPFMHPGGGVMGGGRATAIKMCQDLGIDFERAVAGA